jgi:hypothetical protein
MHVNNEHLSVSLATVEIVALGVRTRLLFTERPPTLTAPMARWRETGTAVHLDRLGGLFSQR